MDGNWVYTEKGLLGVVLLLLLVYNGLSGQHGRFTVRKTVQTVQVFPGVPVMSNGDFAEVIDLFAEANILPTSVIPIEEGPTAADVAAALEGIEGSTVGLLSGDPTAPVEFLPPTSEALLESADIFQVPTVLADTLAGASGNDTFRSGDMIEPCPGCLGDIYSTIFNGA